MGAYGPLAIMLEDLHHFDTTSWAFLTTVVENLNQQVLIVTTMRPNDGVLAATNQHEDGEAVLCCALLRCAVLCCAAESGNSISLVHDQPLPHDTADHQLPANLVSPPYT